MQTDPANRRQRIFGRAVIILGLAFAVLLIAIFSNRGPHAPAWAPVPMHRVPPPAGAS
ncbi:MAG: hypothetical protein ACYDD1_18220 [Caulobacteraceae bacterium]